MGEKDEMKHSLFGVLRMNGKKKCNVFMIDLISTSEEKRMFLDRVFFLPQRLTRILAAIKSFEQSKVFLSRPLKKNMPRSHKMIGIPMDLGIVQKNIGKYKSFEEFKADLDLIWDNCLRFDQEKHHRDCATKMREVVSTFEIEVVPVCMDPGFPMNSSFWEGGENQGPCIKHAIRKMAARVLLSTGYGFASRTALWVLCDAFQRKMLEIIKEVVAERAGG